MKRLLTTVALLGAAVVSAGTMSAFTSAQADNSSYTYTIQDVRNLQDFLLTRPTEEDLVGKPYDMNGDDRWDVFDLCLMKREVLNTMEIETDSDILIAYFTPAENSGVDAISSATVTTWNGEEMGAAEVLANMIHNHTSSDLFSIRTENNYPLEYNELADYAKDEQDNDILPVLTSHINNLDQYSTIIVVFPDWWYTMPQAVYSFFDEYDLSGKTIIPCSTHEGSNLAGSPKTIRELEPDATVIDDGFTVRFGKVADAEEDVIAWVEKQNLK